MEYNSSKLHLGQSHSLHYTPEVILTSLPLLGAQGRSQSSPSSAPHTREQPEVGWHKDQAASLRWLTRPAKPAESATPPGDGLSAHHKAPSGWRWHFHSPFLPQHNYFKAPTSRRKLSWALRVPSSLPWTNYTKSRLNHKLTLTQPSPDKIPLVPASNVLRRKRRSPGDPGNPPPPREIPSGKGRTTVLPRPPWPLTGRNTQAFPWVFSPAGSPTSPSPEGERTAGMIAPYLWLNCHWFSGVPLRCRPGRAWWRTRASRDKSRTRRCKISAVPKSPSQLQPCFLGKKKIIKKNRPNRCSLLPQPLSVCLWDDSRLPSRLPPSRSTARPLKWTPPASPRSSGWAGGFWGKATSLRNSLPPPPAFQGRAGESGAQRTRPEVPKPAAGGTRTHTPWCCGPGRAGPPRPGGCMMKRGETARGCGEGGIERKRRRKIKEKHRGRATFYLFFFSPHVFTILNKNFRRYFHNATGL